MVDIIKDLEKKYAEAKERVIRIEQLLDICRDMESRMKWDCMCSEDEPDENGNRIYVSYAEKYKDLEPGSYEEQMVKKEKLYLAIFKELSKLADK